MTVSQRPQYGVDGPAVPAVLAAAGTACGLTAARWRPGTDRDGDRRGGTARPHRRYPRHCFWKVGYGQPDFDDVAHCLADPPLEGPVH